MKESPLHLLYFSKDYSTHDHRFLQAFIEAGYRVSFLQLRGEQLDWRPIPAGVQIIEWPRDHTAPRSLLGYVKRYRDLQGILAKACPQLVLAGPVHTAAFLVALAGFRPLVAMSWGSDVLSTASKSLRSGMMVRYALRHSAGALGDCQAVRNKIHMLAPLNDAQIVTFPWGVDLNKFFPGKSALSLRQELGWNDKPLLICTRSWEPVYAIDVLIRAFSKLRKANPEVRLILLGDGSEAASIARLISDLDLANYIHAPGRVGYESLPDYFRLADLYVSTALSDGTSVSLLEAMACGLPVVVTNAYGNVEWVDPVKNGWLVPAGDADALTQALNAALSDAARRTTMSEANVALVRSKGDWSRNFPKLLDLFQRVAPVNRTSNLHPLAGEAHAGG